MRDGVVATRRSGAVLIDMTTSEPALAREIHVRPRVRGSRRWTRRCPGVTSGARDGDAVDHGRWRPGRVRAGPAAARGHGPHDRPAGPGRQRAAHQDVQSDRHRVDDDRRDGGVCSTRGAPGSIRRRCSSRSARAQPAAGACRTCIRAWSAATTSPASSSSTSSRTSGSRWARRSRWELDACRAGAGREPVRPGRRHGRCAAGDAGAVPCACFERSGRLDTVSPGPDVPGTARHIGPAAAPVAPELLMVET